MFEMRRVLLVLALLMTVISIACFGCKGGETAVENGAKPQGDSQDTATSPVELHTYESAELGFVIDYPEGWTPEAEANETGALVSFTLPLLDSSGGYEGVAVVSVVLPVLAAGPVSLEEYLEITIGYFEDEGVGYEISDTTLAGYPAKRIDFTYEEEGTRAYQVITLKDEQIYFLLCQAPVQYYEVFPYTFETMVASFEFI
jgi:hypothetical protein